MEFITCVCVLFFFYQNQFDNIYRKYITYTGGEELFGLPVTPYPQLLEIKKQLNLLQKIYSLYNSVIDTVNSYQDILWSEVNIEKINSELLEFQSRSEVKRLAFAEPLESWFNAYVWRGEERGGGLLCHRRCFRSVTVLQPRHHLLVSSVCHDLFLLSPCVHNEQSPSFRAGWMLATRLFPEVGRESICLCHTQKYLKFVVGGFLNKNKCHTSFLALFGSPVPRKVEGLLATCEPTAEDFMLCCLFGEFSISCW